MSEQNKYHYDEVTFALYYDYELDAEESTRFEAALEKDPDLLKAYEQWASAFEHLSQNFAAIEEQYELEGFSQKVMAALPSNPWKRAKVEESSSSPAIAQQESWWAGWFKPILIGSLAAAAVLVVSRSIQSPSPQAQRSTVLINYPDQEESQERAPVIWLLDEEESIEDLESNNDSNDEEDI